jgi:PST family polysaccharide transporter
MINRLKNLLNTEEKKRLLSNFFSLSILQGANYILPLITLPYLIRVLGIEYFGLLSFATATIAYLNNIVSYGFGLTATRDVSIHRDDKEKIIEIFSSVMSIKIILVFISFVFLILLIFNFDMFFNERFLYIFTFGTIIGQALFPVWFFQGMEKMKYITYINILSKSIFTITIFIFIQEKNDYYMVPILTSIGYIVAGILSLILVKKEFEISFRFQNIKTLKYYFIDGWDIFIALFFGNFYRNFNTIVLGIISNNTLVGYYSIAEKVIKIIQTLQNIIGNVLFPFFTKKFDKNHGGFFQLTYKYLKIIIGFYILLMILVYFFSSFITYVINGSYVFNIIINMKIMSIVILIGGLNYYFGILGLVSLNYKKEFSKYIIITGLSNIAISFILINLFEDIGASLSLVISESILLFFILNKILKISKNYKR